MLRLLLGVLSLASCSVCRSAHFHASGEAEKVATVASSFFTSDPLSLTFSSVVSEIKKAAEVMQIGNEGQGNELILGTLRLLGIDSGKVRDLAFDGIISLVHLMGQTLLKDWNGRTGRTGSRHFSFFHFVLGQPQVVKLLRQMRDPALADLLLKESADNLQNSESDTDCIRLLLCKTAPFIRGMQRSLEFFMKREGIPASGDEEACTGSHREEVCRGGGEEASWEKASSEDRMYFFFPGLEEVTTHGDDCDRLFPNCEY